jgi:hypothetical protein
VLEMNSSEANRLKFQRYYKRHRDQKLAKNKAWNEAHRSHLNEYYLKREGVLMADLDREIERLLGRVCQVCGATEHLCLHHKYYTDDSVLPRDRSPIRRRREAIAHPERFQRICMGCHNKVHPRVKMSDRKAEARGMISFTLTTFGSSGLSIFFKGGSS